MRPNVLTLVCAVLIGCAGSIESNSNEAVIRGPQQIIVRLKGAADASQPETMAKMSRAAGATLSYVRPMAGGAHVLATPFNLTQEQFDRALERLATFPEIEYAEPDRIKHHQ